MLTGDNDIGTDEMQRIIDLVRLQIMDHDYHDQYSEARTRWQDTMIREMVGSDQDSVSDKPWIVSGFMFDSTSTSRPWLKRHRGASHAACGF